MNKTESKQSNTKPELELKSEKEIKSKASDNGSEPLQRPPCQFCGKQSKNIFFAAYVCGSEECINKAMDARGGPAGHKNDPKKWMEENK